MSRTPHGGGVCGVSIPALSSASLLFPPQERPPCSQRFKQFLLLPPSGHMDEHIQVMSVTH